MPAQGEPVRLVPDALEEEGGPVPRPQRDRIFPSREEYPFGRTAPGEAALLREGDGGRTLRALLPERAQGGVELPLPPVDQEQVGHPPPVPGAPGSPPDDLVYHPAVVPEHPRELDILYHLTFTFGLPGETRETIRKSVDWCLRMDPDTVQFSVSTPFPGSRFYAELESRKQITSRNWDEYDGFFHAVVRTESLGPEEILEERNAAAKTWEAHAARRARRRALRRYLTPRYAAAAVRSPRKALRKLRELGVLKRPR